MADKMYRPAEMERLLAEGTANELAATRWLNNTVLMRDVGMAERSQMTSNEFALWWRCKTKWFRMTRLLSRRRRAAPAEPEPASYPEDALTPQTVSIMSACVSEGKSRPACKRKLFPDVPTHLVKQDELEVKSSGQRSVQFIRAGRETGFGLFMPANIGAPCKTVDLTCQGPGVMRVQSNSVEEWQEAYQIMDRERPGWCYVPATREIKCKLFRMQHNNENPSHFLSQTKDDKHPVWICMRPLGSGHELTFDYGEGYMEALLTQKSESTDASELNVSVAITPGSVAPVILDESGNAIMGKARYEHTVQNLWGKAAAYDRLDMNADLGFGPTSPYR